MTEKVVQFIVVVPDDGFLTVKSVIDAALVLLDELLQDNPVITVYERCNGDEGEYVMMSGLVPFGAQCITITPEDFDCLEVEEELEEIDPDEDDWEEDEEF